MVTGDAVTLPESRGARVVLALAAGVIGALAWASHLSDAGSFAAPLAGWFWVVDPIIGILCLVAIVWGMPRHPYAIGIVVVVASLVSECAVGVVLLAVGLIATRSRAGEIVVAIAAGTVALLVSGSLYGADSTLVWWFTLLMTVLASGSAAAIGVAAGQRRALVVGLQERAAAAERARAADARAARIEERNRIAHDMHDVVAHRISLISLHASALEYRSDLGEVDRDAAVAAISSNARAALDELRDVLGVLRDPAQVAGPQTAPVAGVADVPALVDEVRAAGADVTLRIDIDGVPPQIVSQSAFRLVREALTNARKHAQGAPVTVSLVGEQGEGLAVRVVNGAGRSAGSPGSGLGLVGMDAVVEAVGGRSTHGPDVDGGFVVSAWLPWVT